MGWSIWFSRGLVVTALCRPSAAWLSAGWCDECGLLAAWIGPLTLEWQHTGTA